MRHKKPTPQGRRRPDSSVYGRETSPSVFSYHAHRSVATTNTGRGAQEEVARPATMMRQPRTTWARRTLHVVVLLTLGALLVSNLLLANTPKIVVVGASGTGIFLRDNNVYQQAARQIFGSSIFNTNKLTVDVGAIREQLRVQFPELADVSVSLPLVGRQPVVYIQPSTSRLLVSTNGGRKVFVVDGAGKAIATGDQATSLRKTELPEVRDESGVVMRLGSVAMPSSNVAFVTEVARQLKAKGMAIADMAMPAGNSELHVRIEGVSYAVKFNMRGDAREEAGAFLATKQYVEAQKKIVHEYIDVRVDNRAYYR